jgi:hypothetical protein
MTPKAYMEYSQPSSADSSQTLQHIGDMTSGQASPRFVVVQ